MFPPRNTAWPQPSGCLAFDSVPLRTRIARDQSLDEPEAAQGAERKSTFEKMQNLARMLSPEQWAILQGELCGTKESDAEDETPENSISGPRDASDVPAMDSVTGKSFAKQYPGAAPVRMDTVGQQPASRGTAISAKAVNSFNEMFPAAHNIKQV